MAHNIGDRVGDYQIIDVLGAGGMGKVYKVRNVISERVEAMKVLLPNLAGDPELADRFMREIKVQASLQHPNIASLHTAQRVDNQLIMMIEFVEGQSIDALIRKGPVSVAQAIDCIKQVLLALAYAHAHGVIHRDIKPANIMVTPSGVVKLMDFGIAKLSEDRRLTQTGRTVGSLYYMSPEQIQGALDLDPRADLYSLGVSLYEMVTLTRPFQGDSDYSIMAAHLNSQPAPPIQLDPTLPQALSDVILMAIARDADHRFQSADAFRNALESVEAQLRVPGGVTQRASNAVPPARTAAATPSVPLPAGPAGGRRGLYMAAGSLVTVVALALLAFQVPKWFKGSEASTVTTTPPVIQQQPPIQNTPVPPDNTNQTIVTPRVERPTRGAAQNTTQSSAQARPPVQTQTQPVPQQSTPQQQPLQTPQPPVQQQQATTPPTENPAKIAALQEARDLLTMLGTRANTTRSTLTRMKEAQARQGLGMRGDILTAEQRMEAFLDDAEDALRAREGDRAKKALASAEREIERIESFLGR